MMILQIFTILFIHFGIAIDVGIRRNIIDLSTTQKDQFLQGLYKMKSTRSKYDATYSSYDYYAFVYIQQGIQQRNGLEFLPWHRAFIYHFEQEMQLFINDSSFRLPFWDLTNELSTFQSLFDQAFLGGNGNKNSNPLPWIISNSSRLNCDEWKIDLRLTATTLYKNYTCLSRQIGVNKMFQSLPDETWWSTILDKNYNIYAHDFRSILNVIHGYIGGHQSSIALPVDPIFFLYIAWIDALWSTYQHKYGLYHMFPYDGNDDDHVSIFEDKYFNKCDMDCMDVMDTKLSLDYDYGLQLDQLPLVNKQWWESDFLWAFIAALLVFVFCMVLCYGLVKCHKKRSTRYLSDSSLSLLWVERAPFYTISNGDRYEI